MGSAGSLASHLAERRQLGDVEKAPPRRRSARYRQCRPRAALPVAGASEMIKWLRWAERRPSRTAGRLSIADGGASDPMPKSPRTRPLTPLYGPASWEIMRVCDLASR